MIYVDAYDGNDIQILGNLDGQMVWKGSQYRRTIWYKNLSTRQTLNNMVRLYRITDDCGHTLEVVKNKTFGNNKTS